MATNYKVLGQGYSGPISGDGYLIYYVLLSDPPYAIVNTISICNTGPSTYYRVAVYPATGPTQAGYIVYDAVINANETILLTLGVTLQHGEYIKVGSTTSGQLSCTAFGVQIS